MADLKIILKLKGGSMKNVLVAACAALILTFPTLAADYTLKVSLETGPNHTRNIILGEIAKDMEAASAGESPESGYDFPFIACSSY